MQTKKKVSAKGSREYASPRVSRAQKKMSENVQVAENKVSDLITSSSRKQKSAGFPLTQYREVTAAKKVNSGHVLTDEVGDVCLRSDTAYGVFVDHKACQGGSAQRIVETMFSPSFHVSKDGGGNTENSVDFMKFFRAEDEKTYQDRGIEKSQVDITFDTSGSAGNNDQKSSCQHYSDMDVDSSMSSDQTDMLKNGDQSLGFNAGEFRANLSSEVSAIYLAMQQSKLECVDEPSPNSMTADVCVEDDDGEEMDYFDPFFFIKNLPNLSAVVPTFRPTLLPKQTRSCPPTTLVLDLDETLVHSSLEPCNDADFTFPVNFNLMKHTVYVRCRPHLMDFMERVAGLFEIIIFTASQSIYAEQLLNVLDPKRKIFRHRVYRDSCVFVDGNYLKDLSVLGRDLARVVIVDNSPQVFGFQVDNGVPIESWFGDRSDRELLLLLPFLESLIGVEDVRPLIAKKFNLQEKVASAVYPSLY